MSAGGKAGSIDVLLVEDNPGDVRLVHESLSEVEGTNVSVEAVGALQDALERLRGGEVDVVLLDLGLPDSTGHATFQRLRQEAPEQAVIVLTGLGDEALALQVMQEGAQDYLVKGRVDGPSLVRAIRYACERQRAERGRRESEARYRALIENAPYGIYRTDFEGRLLLANDRFARMLGYASAAAAEGVDIREHYVDPGVRTDLMARYRKAEGVHSEEVRWRTLDEGVIRVRLSGRPAPDDTGDVRYWDMIAEDVTQQRAVEALVEEQERLLAVAGRVARLGGWSLHLEEGKVWWSDEVCAIHGVPPGTVPDLEEAIAYYPPEWRPTIEGHVTRCIQDGQPFDDELQIENRSGERVWVRAIGEAVRDEQGVIVGVQGAFQDITARLEARRRTRDLEARLVRTLESITDGFFILDGAWRFTYVNAEAERMMKRGRESLVGTAIWEAFPALAGTTFQHRVAEAVASGEPAVFEAFYPPLDIWAEVRAYPSPEGLAVYLRDVTERRQAEEQRRVSEERFQNVARVTSAVIWDWDLEAGTVWRSEGLRQFGLVPEEMDDLRLSFEERVHPEDRDRVISGLDEVLKGDDEYWEEEFRFLRGDGGYAVVEDRGFVMRDTEGRAVRMVGGMSDVTELRQAAERMEEQASLLEKARDAIIVRNLDHSVAFWNPGAERLYGWSAEEVMGRRIDDIIYRERGDFEEPTRELLERGEWVGEIDQLRKDGSLVTVEARWTLVRDRAGDPSRILSINTDITERKKLMAQFLRAQRMDSIGNLAGGMAHDLNNVLQPILMSVGLLRMALSAPDDVETLDIIAESARRGSDLVRQVLNFARGVEGAKVSIDVAALVEDLARVARDTFPKNIEFRTTVEPDLDDLVGDPTQIHQILLNLCVNARDAMPDGGLIHVRAENIDVDANYPAATGEGVAGPHVRLTVADTGAGIPGEALAQIFDPFFTTKELGQGTGLGLSTVQSIARSHGGFVHVYSEPGGGSTFHVCLPVGAAAELVEGRPGDGEELPRGHGETILVVDDEAAIRTVTRQTLESFGYRVLTAVDGADAVGLFAEVRKEVDAVLVDVMMPIMDGPATIRALRRLKPEVPIVACSGLGSNRLVGRVTEAGVQRFLEKPFKAATLLRVVHEVLHRELAPAEQAGPSE